MITLYGIPNCDTVKKARQWLSEQGHAHVFHDFKKSGVPGDKLAVWANAVGLDVIVNRRGTSWRKLDASTQALAADPAGALLVMAANPSVIKRPVVEWQALNDSKSGPANGLNSSLITVGFDPQAWAKLVEQLAKS